MDDVSSDRLSDVERTLNMITRMLIGLAILSSLVLILQAAPADAHAMSATTVVAQR